jgi:hypothetical protein
VTGAGVEANGRAPWEGPTIDAARGLRGTAALGSGSSLELEVLLKGRCCVGIEWPDFLENQLYEDRLAEFKQNCAESGLGRMYRKLGRTRPVATLLSKPGRIGHSWN